MATLTAEPDLIFVDLNTTGTTEITYTKRESDVVWHRYGPGNQNDWFPALPESQTQQLSAEDEKKTKTGWTFISPPVPPGSLYQVKVMRQGADPNETLPEGVEAEVDVPCLLKQPEVRVFITDEAGPEVGGTFVWHKIVTSDTATLKRLSVGLSQPRPSPNGMLKFREVLAATPVPTDITTEEDLEVTGLLPGNRHWALVLVSDRKGNRQQRDYEFTTLQREVTVRFTKLDITNDGDPNGNSDADIHLEILSSGTKNGTARPKTEASFDFKVKNAKSGDTIKLINTHKMGPQQVSRDNQFVLVNVSGVEEDGWFETDETAANFFGDALLDFPQGRGLEKVSKSPKSLWARPQNDDFNFYVHLEFDVKYSKP